MVTNGLVRWLGERREAVAAFTRPIGWHDSDEWQSRNGTMARRAGGFFTIRGFRVESDDPSWSGQELPMIDQPEVGILGFLTRTVPGGDTEILVQAKTEPGNISLTQIGSTVQATVSNYSQVHGGNATPYLGLFRSRIGGGRSVDVEQSEQGTVFLGKYNRNVLIRLSSGAPEPEGGSFAWHPAADLLDALGTDYAVNTDARSVLVCSQWEHLLSGRPPFAQHASGSFGGMLGDSYHAAGVPAETAGVTEWLAGMRSASHFDLEPVPLEALQGWTLDVEGLRSDDTGRFVRLFDVSADDREVPHWQQPLVGSTVLNRVVLACRQHRDGLQFLVRMSPEPGFGEGVQLGPTAQSALALPSGPLNEFALDAGRTVLTVDQSEEGGRFYRTVNRYEIRLIDEGEEPPPDEGARWLTLGSLHRLARMRGYLTNEMRSAMSLLLTQL